jgi:hypothetical protein
VTDQEHSPARRDLIKAAGRSLGMRVGMGVGMGVGAGLGLLPATRAEGSAIWSSEYWAKKAANRGAAAT